MRTPESMVTEVLLPLLLLVWRDWTVYFNGLSGLAEERSPQQWFILLRYRGAQSFFSGACLLCIAFRTRGLFHGECETWNLMQKKLLQANQGIP